MISCRRLPNLKLAYGFYFKDHIELQPIYSSLFGNWPNFLAGGVLFSIEVTATYFAVRNYWRGFSSAVVGALVFQLIGMAADNGETITALFRTDLPVDMPFDPLELFIFAFVGVICGFGGALYVFFHRNIVLLMRKPRIHNILSKNRFIYPSIITIFIASVTYPPGLGRYMAADYTPKEQIDSLFANFSWTGAAEPLTAEQNEVYFHSIFMSFLHLR